MKDFLDFVPSTYSRISTADTNAVAVKGSMAFLHGLDVTNINAAVRYLKLYDKAAAPAETDTPKLRILIPGGSTGGQRVIQFARPVKFSNGLGMRLVTDAADNGTTAVAANEQMVNLYYD